MINDTSETTQTATSIDTATGKAASSDLSTNRVHDIFSAIAKKYERFNAVSSFGAYRAWLNKLVALSGVKSSDVVLDIAAGTGDVTFAIAKACKPCRIQCTDLVDEMLEVARMHYTNGDSCGVPVDFDVVDAQAIPYDDASYDVATMAYGLRNMPMRDMALSEIYRVLKPGGRLVCLDFSSPPNAVWNSLYQIYLKFMIPAWGKIITGDSSGFVYLANSIKAFPDQKGVANMMRNVGFTDVDWHNCSGGIACIHIAYKPC